MLPRMSRKTFTANEAAAELGVSSARVRQMVVDGSLPVSRFGRALVISAEALEQAKQRKTKPGPAPKTPAANKRAGGRIRASNEASTGKKRGKK
jgi:excisionase family DNA binding protein